jgi:MinD superfamily P-loop ATPase
LKQLVVLSGKGGTGKTTVTAALAHLASRELPIVLADADVDAANLELVLGPAKREESDFRSGKVAVIDPRMCTSCGRCAEVCRFDAVLPAIKGSPSGSSREDAYRVDALACEGCASCFYQCPAVAVRMQEQRAGRWFRSDTRFGPLFHAHLFAGQENSGKLVTMVKQQARLLALDTGAALLLVDGPPGIGCPVISASAGADMALLVVEPTVSGVHDLKRVLATTDHFQVEAMVVINKADLNPARSDEIADFCAVRGVAVAGWIPYDTVVTEAMVAGQPVTAVGDNAVARALGEAWASVKEAVMRSDR